MQNYEKEGQIANASVSNIIVLIVGVGVAVLVLIFVGSLGGQAFEIVEDDIDAIGNNLIVGEAFTGTNVTAQTMGHGFIQSNTFAAWNTSNSAQTFSAANFTIDSDAGTVVLKAASLIPNGTALSANYTWGAIEVRESVRQGVISGFNALETTGDYVPIIVLAVVIALVLALVLGFTAFGGRGSGGTAL